MNENKIVKKSIYNKIMLQSWDKEEKDRDAQYLLVYTLNYDILQKEDREG